MTESALWQKLNEIMKGHWTANRIENILAKGTPDSHYSINSKLSGWIELKTDFTIKKGILKITRIEPEQRLWLHNYQKRCGHCFVLAANSLYWYFIKSDFLKLHKGINLKYTIPLRIDELDWYRIFKILEMNHGEY